MKQVLLGLMLLLALAGPVNAVCEDSFAYRAAQEVEEAAERARVAGKAMIGAFETESIDGTPVTEQVFADARLTLVNFWGTFCNPCIEEMPGLAAIALDPPEGVQVLGVVVDWPGNEDVGAQILEATGADAYTHVKPAGGLEDYNKALIGVPSTFFVDAAGVEVGDMVLGTMSEAEFRAAIQTRLEEVG